MPHADSAPPLDRPEPLLNQREVAALLGVSTGALERWRQEGLGPKYLQINPRCVRYRRSAVMAWLASRERTSTKDR